MRAVIVAGGTGGHFYPGLAVAQEWISKKNDVVFFVRKSDFVLPSLQKEKISYEEISAAGFSRKLNFQLFTAFFKLMGGFWQSIIKLRRIKPHLVFVMGGYLSVPVALAAWFLRIPIVLHEQNAIPGLANRLVSKFASKIALSFDTSKTYFSGSVQVTGNPVRQEFYDLPDKSAALEKFNLKNDRFTILVFGGSQGAKRINDLFIKVLLELKNLKDSMQFILISGPKEENEAKSQLKNSPFHYYLAGYCHDMRSAYAASDFVICRSGASTVSELLAVQKPALLIPYPYATNQHQTANAKLLEKVNGAFLMEEKNLSETKLKGILEGILTDKARLALMGENLKNSKDNHPLAAREIIEVGQSVMKKG